MFDASVVAVADTVAQNTPHEAPADAATPSARPAGDSAAEPGPHIRQSVAALVEDVRPARNEVVFIDPNVRDYQAILADLGPNAEVVVLDAHSDGFAQMADYLAGRRDIDAIHLISHGSEAAVQAGSEWLNAGNLVDHADALSRIGGALSSGGDLLLYGCDIGATPAGHDFARAIAGMTGADVAVSSDATGAAARGGNWNLEVHEGAVEAVSFSSDDYASLLVAFSDTLAIDPIGGGAHVATFNTTLGGVSYTYTFTAQGEGGDIAFDSANGSGNSSSVLLTSLSFNASTTERITINRTDTADFTFSTIFVNNSGGSTVTVGGYLNGVLVGSAQTVGTGASSTLNFGGIVVDEVRLTATDFFNTNIDNFGGDTDVPPTITSATYDASTGTMVVTGTSLLALGGGANDIDVQKLTFTGEGGATYTLLDSTDVEIGSATTFSVTLGAADRAAINLIANKNGTSSTGSTTFNLAAADDWNAAVTAGNTADLTGNGVTVSNVAVPTVTSATYDAGTGVLTVTGTGFLSLNGAANDIDVSKLTLTGEGGATRTLTTGSVNVTSGTSFSVTLNGADQAAAHLFINKNGTSSTSGTTYNLAAAEDWAAGADAAVVVADLTGNGVTVSNVAVPAITSATYDAGTGVLTVTGTGFLSLNGAANDIDVSKLTLTGEGGATRTLTTGSVNVTSATSFSVTLNGADQAVANLFINKNGTSSTGGTTYNLAAAEDWAAGADAAVVVADLTGNGVTVSNVAVPTITSATYNAGTGVLTVTGTGFLSLNGATNDIDVSKLSLSGDSTAYALTSTSVEVSSATSFSVTLNGTDTAALASRINQNGTSSVGAVTYNLAAAEDWAAGADAAVVVADLTGNGITASGIAPPPTLGNLHGDSAAWAGIGNTVSLDAGGNATASDATLGALNSGNGDWSGASLAVQRPGTAVSADTFGFNTSGALFSISGGNLQSGGQTFATFTNSSGVLTISFTSSGTAATTALVQDVAQRITYRNDTPAGDAALRFSLSNGSAAATADVTVSSDTIYVTNTTDTAAINVSNGVSFSEAVAIAAADATGSQTIVLDSSLAGQTVSTSSAGALGESLTLDLDAASGATLSGGTLSVGGGFALTATNGSGDTANIATTLSGAGNFIKAGAGSVTLSGSNSYAGTTTVSAGTLAVASDGNLGGGTVTLAAASTLRVTGATNIDNAVTIAGSATVQADANATLSGTLSGGAVTLTKTGTGQLTLSSTGNEAAFTGGITVAAGTLYATDDDHLSAGTLTLDGGTFSSNGNGMTFDNAVALGAGGGTFNIFGGGGAFVVTFSGNITGGGALTKTAAAQLVLSGTNNYSGGTTISAGTLAVAGSANLGGGNISFNGGTLDISGATTLSQNIVLGTGTLVNAGAVTLAGTVGGAGGSLTKSGAGTLTLGGANSGTNWAASVTGGTLAIGAAGNLGSGDLSLNGGTLRFTGATTLANNISLAGAGTVQADVDSSLNGTISGGGTFAKTGTAFLSLGGNNTYSGATTVSVGMLVLDVNNALGTTAGGTTVSSGAVLAVSTGVTVADALILSGVGSGGLGAFYAAGTATASGTVTLAAHTAIGVANGGSLTLSNAVSGGFNLTKLLAGTLTLSGTNTYNGTTTVTAGNLTVTGSTASATTVGTGATLAGTGTVGGLVTVQSGGTLAPGVGGAGTLTLGNGLAVQSGGTLAIDINGATAGSGYDVVAVTGTVDVSSATLSATHGYVPGNGDSYTVITNDAADAVTGTFTGLAEGATVTAGGNATVLTASYIGGTGNDFTLTAPTAPVVTSVSSSTANGSYKIGDTIAVTVTFDTAVFVNTGGGTPTLQLETGATDRTLSYVSGSGTTTLTFNYTVQVGDVSADLDYTTVNALALNGATIRDALSNNAVLTLATPGAANSLGANKAIVVDGVRPTAGVVVTDTSLTVGETSLVTITFSEAVTGFTAADLAVPNGAVSGLATGDGGITWTGTLTPSASTTDATNLVTLANTGVQDIAGNTGTGATDSNNYAIDTATPVAVSFAPSGAAPDGETSLVTITFSEAVSGFYNADMTIVTTGGVTATLGSVTPVNALTYLVQVNTISGIGSVQLNLNGAATGIADLSGNPIGAGLSGSVHTVDTLTPPPAPPADPPAPVVASVGVPAASSYNAGDVLTFTVTTSQAVLVGTTGGTPRLALDIGGTIRHAGYVAGSGGTTLVFSYTVQAGDNDGDGIALPTLLDANGGSLRNAGGKDLLPTLNVVGATASVLVDTLAPAAASLSPVPGSLPTASSVTYTLALSEPVSGLDAGDFSLSTTGGVSASIVGVTAVDARTYQIVVGSMAGNGSLQLNLNGSGTGITDAAGNALASGFSGTAHAVGSGATPPPPPPPPAPSPPAPAPPPSGAVPPTILPPPAPPITPPAAPPTPTLVLSPAPGPQGPPVADGFTPLAPATVGPGDTLPLIVSAPPAPAPDSWWNPPSPTAPPSIQTMLQGRGLDAPRSDPTGEQQNSSSTYIRIDDTGSGRALQAMPDLGQVPVAPDRPFSIALPRATFSSNDPNARVTVDVRLANGQPLPSWIRFDPVSGTISGQPPAGWNRPIELEIRARDSRGNSASTVMQLSFKPAAGRPGAEAIEHGPAVPWHAPVTLSAAPPGLDVTLPAEAAGRAPLHAQLSQFGHAAREAQGQALLRHLKTAAQRGTG